MNERKERRKEGKKGGREEGKKGGKESGGEGGKEENNQDKFPFFDLDSLLA